MQGFLILNLPFGVISGRLKCRRPSSLSDHQHRPHVHRLPIPRRPLQLQASLQPEKDSQLPSQPAVRINKCFREFASRREADRFVEDGRVAVNGVTATSGQKVQPGDVVTLDGKKVQWEVLAAELAVNPKNSPSSPRSSSNTSPPIRARDTDDDDDGSEKLPLEDRFCYIKYWKSRGVVCTCDRSIRGNILDALSQPPPGVRLFTVGRLDKDSTGLILLTSDGRLPNASLRSREGHPKVYRVTADRPIPDEDCRHLASGVVITTVAQRDRGVAKELTAATLPCRLKRDGDGGRRLLIELREGRNRQIRRMLDALGYETLELHRLSFMGIGLSGLWEGEWKALDEREMRILRMAVRAAEANSAAAAMAERQDEEDAEQ